MANYADLWHIGIGKPVEAGRGNAYFGFLEQI